MSKRKKTSRSGLKLTEAQIIRWAKEHHRRTGHWPGAGSGPIHGTNETWKRVYNALYSAKRGLPRRLTLRKLLIKHGLVREYRRPTLQQILHAADQFKRKHGHYPYAKSGIISYQSLTALGATRR